jgi:hypothetical protein
MGKEFKAVFTKSFMLLISLSLMSHSLVRRDYQNLYTTKPGYFAAVDEESYDKMMAFIIDKDMEALNILIDRGKVFQLKEGLKVYLVKHSWGKIIIRPKGYDIKLWTVSEAIK